MKRVRCETSAALVPKDKAIKRFLVSAAFATRASPRLFVHCLTPCCCPLLQVRNIVDASALRDLTDASAIEGYALPKMYRWALISEAQLLAVRQWLPLSHRLQRCGVQQLLPGLKNLRACCSPPPPCSKVYCEWATGGTGSLLDFLPSHSHHHHQQLSVGRKHSSLFMPVSPPNRCRLGVGGHPLAHRARALPSQPKEPRTACPPLLQARGLACSVHSHELSRL